MIGEETHGDYCYSHRRRESVPREAPPIYQACRECNHVWWDADEFLWDVEGLYQKLDLPFHGLRDEDHLACPLCSTKW